MVAGRERGEYLFNGVKLKSKTVQRTVQKIPLRITTLYGYIRVMTDITV
jgi:hypothetical protein